MNIDALVKAMTPEVYERLRQAAETGKWPDGTLLSEKQREDTMHAVMLYQAKVMGSEEHMTVNANGEIVHKSRAQLKQEMSQQQDIARFTQDDF